MSAGADSGARLNKFKNKGKDANVGSVIKTKSNIGEIIELNVLIFVDINIFRS